MIQHRFPSYAFVLITTAGPQRVSTMLRDDFGITSRCTAVRVIGSAEDGVTARFKFAYPLPPSPSWPGVRVRGVAVPSVAGSNVHVRVRPVASVAAVDAAALVAAIAALAFPLESPRAIEAVVIALLLLSASIAIMAAHVSRIKEMLRTALPGWSS